MKKLLLTFALFVSAVAAKAFTATIYVQAEEAPFLYAWYTSHAGKETNPNGKWPGAQMTETVTKKNKEGQDVTLWYKTFEIDGSSFNIIFNNGLSGVDQMQTGNITTINSDRYFTYNGKTQYTDITEEFGVEVPDVEIETVALISELNEWNGLAQLFTEVEKNKKYTINVDLENEVVPEDCYVFKFIVNSSAYIGWSTEGLTINDPLEWIEEDTGGGNDNMLIDLSVAGTKYLFFTLEFAGGKDIYQGWTLSVEKGTAGINNVVSDAAANRVFYNLAGQPVNDNYRGLIVTKGKKMLKK